MKTTVKTIVKFSKIDVDEMTLIYSGLHLLKLNDKRYIQDNGELSDKLFKLLIELEEYAALLPPLAEERYAKVQDAPQRV